MRKNNYVEQFFPLIILFHWFGGPSYSHKHGCISGIAFFNVFIGRLISSMNMNMSMNQFFNQRIPNKKSIDTQL